MENITVSMSMDMYRELLKKDPLTEAALEFLDEMSWVYLPGNGGPIRYSNFDSIQQACYKAREILGFKDVE